MGGEIRRLIDEHIAAYEPRADPAPMQIQEKQ